MMPLEVIPPSAEIGELIKKTNKREAKRKDIVALREALRNTELWSLAGDIAEHAVARIVDGAAGGVAFVEESLREGVRQKRAELLKDEDGPLEMLLVEQVTVAWLALYTTQHAYDATLAKGTSIRNADCFERRLNGAHRRFVRACEALARIRKLGLRGPFQVNVAADGGTFQQVNTKA